MTELEYLIDLHRSGERQGPGSSDDTRTAIRLSGLDNRRDLRIADVGCGTGASTLTLAQSLDAAITAVDFLPEFLVELEQRAKALGVTKSITTLAASMETLPFEESSLDAIWSEGAIYNIGFAKGIQDWRFYLKPHGVLAVSELTWLTKDVPEELDEYWSGQYSEVATAGDKVQLLEEAGYALLGYFALPPGSWMDNYYHPLMARFDAFLKKHEFSETAQSIVRQERLEIDMYERYSDFFSYGYYVARKVAK